LACHTTQQDQRIAAPAALFSQPDIHRENGFVCADCHGGDPSAGDKARAHDAAKQFKGRPAGQAIVEPASWKLAATDQKTLQTVCEEVTQRAKQTLSWVIEARLDILSITFDKFTLARTALYAALLDPSLPLLSCDSAVDGLRQAGAAEFLARGLLTRAWVRWLKGDEAGCRAELDEAWEIAEPGPMRLHMADVLLTRARLFRDRDALAQARTLIEQCSYGRRFPELEDAEAVLL
jgi:hypothetical protein